MNEIEAILKKIIMKQSNINLSHAFLGEPTNLVSDLGFDSISLVNLILEIENKFNIEIDNYDFEVISDYGKLLEMILKIVEKEGV